MGYYHEVSYLHFINQFEFRLKSWANDIMIERFRAFCLRFRATESEKIKYPRLIECIFKALKATRTAPCMEIVITIESFGVILFFLWTRSPWSVFFALPLCDHKTRPRLNLNLFNSKSYFGFVKTFVNLQAFLSSMRALLR